MGCGGSSGSSGNTTTSTSGPPQVVLDAYGKLINQAQNVAGQPLQQYSGPLVAGFTPDQLAGMGTVNNMQGIGQPYINQAAAYMQTGAQPINPGTFDTSSLPGQWQDLSDKAGGTLGTAQDYATNATNPLYMQGYDTLSEFTNPYTKQVTDTTRALFDQQNQQQQQQIQGNAVAHNAYGGDREAVAQALAAQQENIAQAPVLANIQQQGFQQAQQELNAQQALELQKGTTQGQLNLGAAGAYNTSAAQQAALAQQKVAEYNAQQTAGIGAQTTSGWLQQGAGYGMAGLGKQAQDQALAGAQAQLGTGALQQQQAQARLNIPYEMFTQQQAYPFQNTSWLGNITTGIGSNAGSTGKTTSPGPNPIAQLAGLGVAGAGLYKATDGFGGLFGGSGGNAGTDYNNQFSDTTDLTGFGDFGGGGARGGRVGYDAGGRVGYAVGGGAEDLTDGGSIPDVSIDFIPGAAPGGSKSGSLSPFAPVVSQTSSGGGGGGSSGLGEAASALGSVATIAKLGSLFLAHGGRIPGYDLGGVAPVMHAAAPIVSPGLTSTAAPSAGGPVTLDHIKPVENYQPVFDAQGYPIGTKGVSPDAMAGPPNTLSLVNGVIQRPNPGGPAAGAPGPAAPAPTNPNLGPSDVILGFNRNASGGLDPVYGQDPMYGANQRYPNDYTPGGVYVNPYTLPGVSSGDGGGGGFRGGRVDKFDGGGAVTTGIPNLAKSYIPDLAQIKLGPGPAPPPKPGPVQDTAKDLSTDLGSLAKIFKDDDKSDKSPGGSSSGGGDNNSVGGDYGSHSLGGVVDPYFAYHGYDLGGPVSQPRGSYIQQAGQIMTGGQTPAGTGQVDQYLQMPIEKLQALAMQASPNTRQGAAILHALQVKQMQGTQPTQSADTGTGLGSAWRGGRQHFADGGVPASVAEAGMEDYHSPEELRAGDAKLLAGMTGPVFDTGMRKLPPSTSSTDVPEVPVRTEKGLDRPGAKIIWDALKGEGAQPYNQYADIKPKVSEGGFETPPDITTTGDTAIVPATARAGPDYAPPLAGPAITPGMGIVPEYLSQPKSAPAAAAKPTGDLQFTNQISEGLGIPPGAPEPEEISPSAKEGLAAPVAPPPETTSASAGLGPDKEFDVVTGDLNPTGAVNPAIPTKVTPVGAPPAPLDTVSDIKKFATAAAEGTAGVGTPPDTGDQKEKNWNPHFKTFVDVATQRQMTPVSMRVLTASGLAEGGFASPWNNSKVIDPNSPTGYEISSGPWQLHLGGEYDRYHREKNPDGDMAAQTNYVITRANEISNKHGWGDFTALTDQNKALQVMNEFERSKGWEEKGPGYIAAQLPAADAVLAGGPVPVGRGTGSGTVPSGGETAVAGGRDIAGVGGQAPLQTRVGRDPDTGRPRIEAREPGIAGSKWFPLIAAGLGIAASRNPSALGAIGEGGLVGVKAAQTQEVEAAKADQLRAERERHEYEYSHPSAYQSGELAAKAVSEARQAAAEVRQAATAQHNYEHSMAVEQDRHTQIMANAATAAAREAEQERHNRQQEEINNAYKKFQMAQPRNAYDASGNPQSWVYNQSSGQYDVVKGTGTGRPPANATPNPAAYNQAISTRATEMRKAWDEQVKQKQLQNPAYIAPKMPDFAAQAKQAIDAERGAMPGRPAGTAAQPTTAPATATPAAPAARNRVQNGWIYGPDGTPLGPAPP